LFVAIDPRSESVPNTHITKNQLIAKKRKIVGCASVTPLSLQEASAYQRDVRAALHGSSVVGRTLEGLGAAESVLPITLTRARLEEAPRAGRAMRARRRWTAVWLLPSSSKKGFKIVFFS
jgi:hypothetical protein